MYFIQPFISIIGMCEAVMICDNIAKQLPVSKYDCYPCVEQDEEDDDLDSMAQSFDLNSGQYLHPYALLF